MNTTLPFHAAVETGLPSRSFTKNAGIGCGWAANRTTCASSARSVVFALLAANNADDARAETLARRVRRGSQYFYRARRFRTARGQPNRQTSKSGHHREHQNKRSFHSPPCTQHLLWARHNQRARQRSERDCAKTRQRDEDRTRIQSGTRIPKSGRLRDFGFTCAAFLKVKCLIIRSV